MERASTYTCLSPNSRRVFLWEAESILLHLLFGVRLRAGAAAVAMVGGLCRGIAHVKIVQVYST